jgi:protein involved in polysaccharide export with SLBB domain
MLLKFVRRASSLFNLSFPLAIIGTFGWLLHSKLINTTSAGAAVLSSPPAVTLLTEKQVSTPKPKASEGSAIVVNSVPPRPGDETIVEDGDTLQLTFYERLISEEDKWTARSFSKRPPISFQQRAELSGEFDVHEDGNIILPLLGAFHVSGRTVSQFEADVKPVFEQLVGRFAFMSVVVSRQPVYVVGPVKKPGGYKFVEGMTVLHLIAIAGGLERTAVDLNHMLQAVHEVETKQKSGDRLKHLWAKLTVLKAEHVGAPPVASSQLLNLVNEAEAKQLIADEVTLRSLALKNRQVHEASLSTAVQAAGDELQNHVNRRDQVQTGVTVRTERVNALNTIKDKIGRPIRAQAEAELSDVKVRLQETSLAIHEGESKLAQLQKDLATFKNQTQIDDEQEIADLQLQIADASSTKSASGGALDAMRTALVSTDDGVNGDVHFQIVRRTHSEQEVLDVSGTATVKPGDLVQIIVAEHSSTPPM